jgi:hypothetical protein
MAELFGETQTNKNSGNMGLSQLNLRFLKMGVFFQILKKY